MCEYVPLAQAFSSSKILQPGFLGKADSSRKRYQRRLGQFNDTEAAATMIQLDRTWTRRGAIVSTLSAVALLPFIASAVGTDSLENLSLGEGRWTQLDRNDFSATSSRRIPSAFCTYATRFLINYDSGVLAWWDNLERTYSLLPEDERQANLGQSFGSLARTVELAMDQAVENKSPEEAYLALWDQFASQYGDKPSAMGQLAILFSLLPEDRQPRSRLKQVVTTTVQYTEGIGSTQQTYSRGLSVVGSSLCSLLPEQYHSARLEGTGFYTVDPALPLFEVGLDEEFRETATATIFGPLATKPLVRETPRYSPDTYALFGLSGATGCALTHTVVIPIDVVKTRNQVDPEEYNSFLGSAARIFKEEGLEGLLLGAQATIAGYFWYGLSVYPSYTFFKRLLAHGPLLPPEVATVHANDIALVAGALAAVLASLGLTPLEAARIRVVADPEGYRPLGLPGTLSYIAQEDSTLGWKALYAGLPSLLIRQVLFGSVKFLAFERGCEFIFSLLPVLRDATWTMLGVSLVAGGFSGALSSVISQPADSVLTFVAQNSDGSSSSLGVIEGCRVMVERDGPSALFRGLRSRCVWAAAIIAGQFLLYDVFRTWFGVNSDDLLQVYHVVIPSVS